MSAPFYDIPVPLQGSSAAPPLRMMAVDILPTAIPIDASKHFSDRLLPYLTTLIEEFSFKGSSAFSAENEFEKEDGGGEKGETLSAALRRATVARGGELMEGHKWLRELVEPHVGLTLGSEAAMDEEKNEAKTRDNDKAKRKFPPQLADKDSNSMAYPPQVSQMAGRLNHRDGHGQSPGKKRVLLLGSGMVAQPVVDYLVCKAGVEVRIG